MRTSAFIFIPILGMLLAACSSAPTLQSDRQTKPIVVDGNASDWTLPLAYYDKGTKLSFSISNDSSKLYFCLQAFDVDVQKKICLGGLQLWLDTTGGTGKEIGLLYPVPSTLIHSATQGATSSSGYGNQNQSGVNSEEFDPIGMLRHSFFRSQADQIQLTGFHAPAVGLIPVKNAFGIEVRINWDTVNNVLNYEAAIPFSVFYRSLTVRDSSTTIGLTFTVNGITRPGETAPKRPAETGGVADNGSGADDGYPGGMGGGGMGGGDGGITPGGTPGGMGVPGGMGGGMGHGGGRRGGSHSGGSGNSELSEPASLSIKLQLAKIS